MYIIKLFFINIRKLPEFLLYLWYDFLCYVFFRKKYEFYGWGLHIFTGKFGAGKTSLMTAKAYDLCDKYPQLTVVTNLCLINFPEHTQILPLNTIDDILNAPKNCLVLIDEVGTIFNSRDFMCGKKSFPKELFQFVCQCRKRKLMIYGTAQRFCFVDKQLRDITATVTECFSSFRHPFTRKLTAFCYDIDEYEAGQTNPLYEPRPFDASVYIQSEKYRHLYDTAEMVKGMLEMEYDDEATIMMNRGQYQMFSDGSKEGQKAYKKSVRRRR